MTWIPTLHSRMCKRLQKYCAKSTKKQWKNLHPNAKMLNHIKKTKIFAKLNQKNQGKNIVHVVQYDYIEMIEVEKQNYIYESDYI